MVKHELKKLTHYEYWPFWIFYSPMVPVWLWYSLKSGSLLYFTTVNPIMKYGGFFNYSKLKMQEMLDAKFRPQHVVLPLSERNNFELPFDFPFIVKPNIGERGKGVQLIQNEHEWNVYLNHNKKDLILQNFISSTAEYSIFYARLPHEEKGKILSITGKKFLTFSGNGKTSLREFIESDSRAYFNKSYLYMKFHEEQDLILPQGKNMILEEIGNHNRGTYFYDAQHLKTDALESAVNEVLKNCDGFYYGRIDVKAENEESFKKGEFKILEFNGANSEAGHIYDKNINIIKAYKEVLRHLKKQFQISKINMQNGVQPAKLGVFLKDLKDYML